LLSILALPLIASALAAVACGAVGTFCVVRRNTYAAGALSHACFAGLGLAQWLAVAHGCAWATPTLGALAAAVAAAFFLALSPVARGARADGALSALWAVGMAVGLAFLSATPGYQGSLVDYLFGSILFVSRADLVRMAAFDAALLATLLLFWRGLVGVAFNERLAALRGAPVRLHACALSLATALAVVVLVRAVGIVLCVALLALPALAARPLARRLGPMMLLAGLFAFVSLAAGLLLAWRLDCQPSAPAVLVAALLAAAIRSRKALLPRRAPPPSPSHAEPHPPATAG